MLPIEDLYVEPDWNHIYDYVGLSDRQKRIYDVTFNGHKLPSMFIKNKECIVPHDWFNCPGRQYLVKTVISVDVNRKTAVIRERSKKEFNCLYRRYKSLIKKYVKNKEMISNRYSESKEKLTSMEFWIHYLQIE